MSKVNLLPKEELEKKTLGKFLKWILTYGRYTIISVEMVVFMVFFSRFIFDQQLAELQDSIEQKQAIAAAAQDFEKHINSVQFKLQQVKQLEAERTLYLDFFTWLQAITPHDIGFTRIIIEGSAVTLHGEAATNESFAKFLSLVKNDPRLANISLEQLEGSAEKHVLVFSINAVLIDNAFSI